MLDIKYVKKDKGINKFNFNILLKNESIFEGHGWDTKKESAEMLSIYLQKSNLLSIYNIYIYSNISIVSLLRRGLIKLENQVRHIQQ